MSTEKQAYVTHSFFDTETSVFILVFEYLLRVMSNSNSLFKLVDIILTNKWFGKIYVYLLRVILKAISV